MRALFLPSSVFLEVKTDVARLLRHSRGRKSGGADRFGDVGAVLGELSVAEDRHLLHGRRHDAARVELLLVQSARDEAADDAFERGAYVLGGIDELEAGVIHGEAILADR